MANPRKRNTDPGSRRGPGKSYRIVSEAGAIRQERARGWRTGGYAGGYIGAADPNFTPPEPQRKVPGATNRSKPTRTPQSLQSRGTTKYIFPDRPDGTGNRSDQRRINGPWPGGPGTRVVYKGSQFWQGSGAGNGGAGDRKKKIVKPNMKRKKRA
jgi:hypothetical protein